MLFIQSLTYALTNPDDGECETYKSRTDCLEEESPFATGESKCSWDATKESCEFVEPDSDIKVVLFVAIFSAILATPLALLADWIIMYILAAPTKCPSSIKVSCEPTKSALENAQSLVENKNVPVRGLVRYVSARLASLTVNNDLSSDSNRILIKAQEELESLTRGLQSYRRKLNEQDLAEFDALWGLDSNGAFKVISNNGRNKQSVSRLITSLKQSIIGNKKDSHDEKVSQRVLVDLISIQRSLYREKERFEGMTSDRDKGKRLLYLFQLDLLPGVSGKILESKGQRDFASVGRVHILSKVAAWVFIVLFNAGMLFYILLFALTQNRNRQGAWAASFAVYLVVEILLISSLIVMIVHVMLPSLILKDVAKIKQKLVENIRDFNRNLKRKTDDSTNEAFNAADYLFLSTRLAKELPDLKEAKIIAQFKTPWPKQSYQHVANVSKAYSKKFSALTRSMSILLIWVITTFLDIPPSLQDMVMQMVITVVVGYLVLVHIELYIIFPILIGIPLLVIGIIVHFVIQSGKAQEKVRIQKLMKELEPEIAEIHPAEEAPQNPESAGIAPYDEADNVDYSIYDKDNSEEDGDMFASNVGPLHLPLGSVNNDGPKHVSRRQSIQQGLNLARQVQASLADRTIIYESDQCTRCSNDTGGNEDGSSEKGEDSSSDDCIEESNNDSDSSDEESNVGSNEGSANNDNSGDISSLGTISIDMSSESGKEFGNNSMLKIAPDNTIQGEDAVAEAMASSVDRTLYTRNENTDSAENIFDTGVQIDGVATAPEHRPKQSESSLSSFNNFSTISPESYSVASSQVNNNNDMKLTKAVINEEVSDLSDNGIGSYSINSSLSSD